ncbi:xylulokinase [Paracoccus alcaliphilus]|uniref:Xylulose kinase n=1 Tax=Paracoccus alcaliphilus TaxID=34002 RepID=A0A1H8HEV0_9RHOB|nr:xylulokinase [Paracoccus alcaliphilus]WCR20687.1 xylulokinase [Paracoccus alcaliphilus]SEN54600.1 xylulokinase [Paracoccus alcaliphilus]
MYLGLDIGTSGIKAMLVDEAFATVGVAHAALTVSRPHPGWSEQDPAEWISAAESVIADLRRDHPQAMAALKAIGLSGHMHGATLLDASDKVLRPCILWNDGRSGPQCATLTGAADFHGIAGNLVMAGFTAPKLLWVSENEPDIFAQTAKVLLPKDYLRLWLTGEHVAEMSDAAGTLWLDVARRDWSDDLLAATGLTRDHMPRLVEGSDVSGHLRADLAARLGVPAVPVAGGGGDNAATACGMGVMRPGTGFLSLGTSGVLFAATDRYQPNTGDAVHTFCHAIPDTWHQMGVILSATDSLTWLSEITGRTVPDLAAMVDQVTEPSPVSFLPYLSGERTPLNDPDATAAFYGLRRNTGLPDLVQAAMEGVAMAFADCVRALRAAGTRLEAAYAVGGGARSRAWLQLMASATGLVLLEPEDGDFGAAFGAARLAAACAENDISDRVFSQPKIHAEIHPDANLGAALAEKYDRNHNAYTRLRPLV